MDDELEPKDIEDTDDELEDFDDDIILGKKKSKGVVEEEDSLDALAEEEDGILPEDSYDDRDDW